MSKFGVCVWISHPAPRYLHHGENCRPLHTHIHTLAPMAVKNKCICGPNFLRFQEISFLNSFSLLPGQSIVHNLMRLSKVFRGMQKVGLPFSKVRSPLAGRVSGSEELGTIHRAGCSLCTASRPRTVCTEQIGVIVCIWA